MASSFLWLQRLPLHVVYRLNCKFLRRLVSSVFLSFSFDLMELEISIWMTLPSLVVIYVSFFKTNVNLQIRGIKSYSCIYSMTLWEAQGEFLEKEMATHSRVLAWRIPESGEPCGLLSLGSQRVGHDWSDWAAAARIPSLGIVGWTTSWCRQMNLLAYFFSQQLFGCLSGTWHYSGYLGYTS